jgi:hypothetical protein
MHDESIIVVGPEGAALAPFLPIRAEHEVLDDELTFPRKELVQALLSVQPLEDILFVDADPRQSATLRAQLIAQSRKFLFLCQMLLARFDPLVLRNDPVPLH